MKSSGIEEMLRDFSSGTYDLTCNGECTQCGECCSNMLPMTDSEIKTIHKYIKENGINEHKLLLPLSKPALDMTCPFLNSNKDKEKCDIYSVRPRICRDFICCPSKRKEIDNHYKKQCRIVDVRKEFYENN